MFSRKLTIDERNLTIFEKESLTIQKSLIQFRELISCSKLQIFIDNKNVTFSKPNFNNTKKLKEMLVNFYFEIKHIEGHKNKEADYLSRVNCLEEKELEDFKKMDYDLTKFASKWKRFSTQNKKVNS